MNNTTTKTKQTIDVRKLVFTALLSAMAVVLMKFLAFKIPIMPDRKSTRLNSSHSH